MSLVSGDSRWRRGRTIARSSQHLAPPATHTPHDTPTRAERETETETETDNTRTVSLVSGDSRWRRGRTIARSNRRSDTAKALCSAGRFLSVTSARMYSERERERRRDRERERERECVCVCVCVGCVCLRQRVRSSLLPARVSLDLSHPLFVYLCVYVYECVRVCMYVCVYVYSSSLSRTHTHTHDRARALLCVQGPPCCSRTAERPRHKGLCVCVCAFVCVCVCVCVCVERERERGRERQRECL